MGKEQLEQQNLLCSSGEDSSMIKQEILDVLESEWVVPKRDKECNRIWGFELLDGAPSDVQKKFQQFLNVQAAEDKIHGYE